MMFGPRNAANPTRSRNGASVAVAALPLLQVALAAIAQSLPRDVLDRAARLQNLSELRTISEGAGGWKVLLKQALEQPLPQDERLIALAASLGLSEAELLTVALAVAVEHDIEIANTIAVLQQPVAGSRPTLGLLTRSLSDGGDAYLPVFESIIAGPALRCGLLVLAEGTASYGERTLRVPLPLILALRGGGPVWPGSSVGLRREEALSLSQSEQAQIRREAQALLAFGQRCLAIRAASDQEARTAATLLAEALHLQPLFLSGNAEPGLGAWLRLYPLLPVHSFTLAPAERRSFPLIEGYDGPAVALPGLDGDLDWPAGAVPCCRLEMPSRSEREDLWSAHTGDPGLACELASKYRLRSGRIADLARLGKRRAALDGRMELNAEDVYQAAQSGEASGLSSLAELVSGNIHDEALIVPLALRRELQMLCFRCQSRESIADDLGISFRGRYRPGVLSLFFGPSGTGKTLAASWLASRLRLPLYRVDLASITSKWVGETERNLSRLLTCAEQAGVILLFDEADSLFGRRTEVRDSNDRFANAQTNYLPQRMENFDGIAVLTTNSRSRLDTSFARRIEAILEFPLPDPAQRRALWESHLGTRHKLTPTELNALAVSADLTGGEIRNAGLAAATYARSRQSSIEGQDVCHALAAEYRKLGRHLPDGLWKPLPLQAV